MDSALEVIHIILTVFRGQSARHTRTSLSTQSLVPFKAYHSSIVASSVSDSLRACKSREYERPETHAEHEEIDFTVAIAIASVIEATACLVERVLSSAVLLCGTWRTWCTTVFPFIPASSS